MKSSFKVIVPSTRPISEGVTKGNVNPRPDGPKPAASAKPEGQPTSSGGSNPGSGSPSAPKS